MVSLTLYNLINTWDIFKDKKYLNFLNNGCSTWFRSQLLISLVLNSSQSVFTTKNDKRLMEHCILERMVNRSCSCQCNLNVSRILSVWQRCWPWNVCYRRYKYGQIRSQEWKNSRYIQKIVSALGSIWAKLISHPMRRVATSRNVLKSFSTPWIDDVCSNYNDKCTIINPIHVIHLRFSDFSTCRRK